MTDNLAPVDPNAKIPAAVKAAASMAEELHKRVYSKEEDAPETKPEETRQPEQGQNHEETQQPEQAPEQTSAPASTQQVTPEGNNQADWKHRYDSMKGRFEQAQRALQAQSARIAELENTIRDLQEKREEPAAPAQALLTPEDIEAYGTEFIDVVRRAAREESLAEIRSLKETIKNLEAQLHGVQGHVVKSAREQLFENLTREVPNWQEINVNPEFHAWLALPDPYSGVIRQELLNAAFERNDSPRTIAFFKGFLDQEAAVVPRSSGPDENTRTPTSAKVPLAELAAPGRAKTAAGARPPAEKPIITRAQITRFYTDCAAGKYVGREEEKLRMERMIHEAGMEGRIR